VTKPAALLALAERSGAARTLLTSYAAAYDPAAAELETGQPMQMDFDHFTGDGIPHFRPRVIPGLAGTPSVLQFPCRLPRRLS
jgi:hypothetical protein